MSNPIAAWNLPPSPQSKLKRLDLLADTLDAGTRLLPGGGYSTFRTFGPTGVLRLGDHFKRLEETAHLAGIPIQFAPQRVRAALRQAVTAFGDGEKRVRIILDLHQEIGSIYLLIDHLHTPSPEDYRQGIHVVTRQMQRQNPKAKLTGFIEQAEQVRHELPPGVSEAIMVGADGEFLEGLTSNFFAVFSGQVWTAEHGVLAGITRSLVLEAVSDLEIPLHLVGANRDAVDRFDEAFITSASRAILPVRQIDAQFVGSGQPGSLTQRLADRYQAMVSAAVEQI